MSKTKAMFIGTAVLLIAAAGAASAAGGDVVAVRAAKVVTGTGTVIDGGTVIIKDGLITAVGAGLAVPAGAKVIDVPDGWVFPGFIDALTDLGASDRPTLEKDSDEATSPITPQLRIVDAIDPGNAFLARARATGLTGALAAPALGNLLSGQSAVIRLAGDGVEAMTVKFPVAVHGSLGEAPKLRYGQKGQMPMTRMGEAAMLRQTFWDVRGYIAAAEAFDKKLAEHKKKVADGKEDAGPEPAPPVKNLQMEALVPVIKGELPLVLNANRMDDILTALRIADEFGLKLIISGGAEAHRVKDELLARKVPVLVRPANAARLTQETERADYANVVALQKAGVKIAFQTGSTADYGELIPQAMAVVAHGLPWTEALKAVTVNPAAIFGVLDRCGTLEKGKSADLAVFDANPFLRAAVAKAVLIAGKVVVEPK